MYHVNTQFHAPSTSPPSSPGFGPIDSSPLPSPTLNVLDSPPQSPFHTAHPFAASTKANRIPPQYEKKHPVSRDNDYYSGHPSKRHKSSSSTISLADEDEDDLWADTSMSTVWCSPQKAVVDRESTIWDTAITSVFDNINGTITLPGQRLSHIPRRIGELANYFVLPEKSEQVGSLPGSSPTTTSRTGSRPLSRVNTAPAGELALFPAPKAGSFGRARTLANVSIGLPKEEIQLFLSSNQIQDLPPELFTLQKMTVLVLRGNKLEQLPPEIAHLKHLRELNVAYNNLQYLPSEMLEMALEKLYVHPNPFLSPPSSPRTRIRQSTTNRTEKKDIQVSKTQATLPRVIPLVEICLRILLSRQPGFEESVLSARYQLPLSEIYDIPEHLRHVLQSCVPGAIASSIVLISPENTPSKKPHASSKRSTDGITGIGCCPNPLHRSKAIGEREPIFIRHAEERYTWEDCVGGANTGGSVPVRWRGCSLGCLDFLDSGAEEEDQSMTGLPSSQTAVEEGVMKVMKVDSGGLDFEAEGFDDY